MYKRRYAITKAFRRIRNYANSIYGDEFFFLHEAKNKTVTFLKDGTFIAMGERLIGDYYSFTLPINFKGNFSDALEELCLKKELEIIKPIDNDIMRFTNDDLYNYSQINVMIRYNNKLNVLEEHKKELVIAKNRAISFIENKSWKELQSRRYGHNPFVISIDGDINLTKKSLITLGDKRSKKTLLQAVEDKFAPHIKLAQDMIDSTKEKK